MVESGCAEYESVADEAVSDFRGAGANGGLVRSTAAKEDCVKSWQDDRALARSGLLSAADLN